MSPSKSGVSISQAFKFFPTPSATLFRMGRFRQRLIMHWQVSPYSHQNIRQPC